jgi:aspartyl-tRNA(Asn)/glutamyl-tRNA(Gln) amidotransferase subunit C
MYLNLPCSGNQDEPDCQHPSTARPWWTNLVTGQIRAVARPRRQHQAFTLRARHPRLATPFKTQSGTGVRKVVCHEPYAATQALSPSRVECYNNIDTKDKMKLDREQVQHIAWLARLGLTDAEIEKFSLQLSHILENFEILKEVDTSDVAPATRAAFLQNVFREDVAANSYPQADILRNAPKEDENCFRVKAILE